MVSQARPGVRDGPAQLGHQPRRDRRPPRRAAARPGIRLAVGVRRDRGAGARVARLLAPGLSPAGLAPPRVAGRAGVHPPRRGGVWRGNPLGAVVAAPADVGGRRRKAAHRSGVWFYLYWLPKFLNEHYGLTLAKMGLPLVTVYLFSDAGSIAGGWLSSMLLRRAWSVNAARKTTLLVCAIAVTPIAFASQVTNLWGAVGLVGLAAAAHQGWSANMFTLASDMFPRRAVGSVVGIGGMAGAV